MDCSVKISRITKINEEPSRRKLNLVPVGCRMGSDRNRSLDFGHAEVKALFLKPSLPDVLLETVDPRYAKLIPSDEHWDDLVWNDSIAVD